MLPEVEAKAFVVAHHYSRSYPAARFRAGLFREGRLVGAAVFSESMNPHAVASWSGGHRGVELGRFVLLDEIEFNAETWFLRRALTLLRQHKGTEVVLAYSDPVPRRTLAGEVVTPGHVGQIYQAYNAVYRGRSRPRMQLLDPLGRSVSERAVSKALGGERGAGHVLRALLDVGAPEPRLGESPVAWRARAVESGTLRLVRHPGNYAYLLRVPGARVELPPAAGPYPRKAVGVAE